MLHILIGLFIIIVMIYLYLNRFNITNISSYSIMYNGTKIGSTQNNNIDIQNNNIMKNNRRNVKLQFNNQRQNIKLNYRNQNVQNNQNNQNNQNVQNFQNTTSFLHTNHYIPSSLLHMYKSDDLQPADPYSSVFHNYNYPINWKINVKGKITDKKSFFSEKSLNDT